jgi:hypothetical protein
MMMPIPYDAIRDERRRQDAKWDEQNHDDLFWLGIVVEETGEVGKACIEHVENDVPVDQYEAELRSELVQVAACAVAWIEAIDRRRARRMPSPCPNCRSTSWTFKTGKMEPVDEIRCSDCYRGGT